MATNCIATSTGVGRNSGGARRRPLTRAHEAKRTTIVAKLIKTVLPPPSETSRMATVRGAADAGAGCWLSAATSLIRQDPLARDDRALGLVNQRANLLAQADEAWIGLDHAPVAAL